MMSSIRACIVFLTLTANASACSHKTSQSFSSSERKHISSSFKIEKQPCEKLKELYELQRETLNQCSQDSDCAEYSNTVCPVGPHYIHREANIDELVKLVDQIRRTCDPVLCEPFVSLGPATCVKNRCQQGRQPIPSTQNEICWDVQETYLETGIWHETHAYSEINHKTPRLAFHVREPGKAFLRRTTNILGECESCPLLISEHDASFTSPLENVVKKKDGSAVVYEFSVKSGIYYLIRKNDNNRFKYSFKLRLEDEKGKPMDVTYHGSSWQRHCEEKSP